MGLKLRLTDYHAKYYAYELTKKCSSNSIEKLVSTLADAQVEPKPHQIDAALFAFKSPLSKGAILADEVGLGKTIEAGIVISQKWAERKRRILIIVPSTLRKQWHQELLEKFFLHSIIMESKSFNEFIKKGIFNPFEQNEIIISSYNFVRNKEHYVKAVNWDLVIIDEAHRLRNVYKNSNRIARAIKDAIASSPKILLTATPLQNTLLELYGLVSFIDAYTFGDFKSFKSQFARLSDDRMEQFTDLKERLAPICKRTLRKQVLEYINYTNRKALTQEFYPSDKEQMLYDSVTGYLQKTDLRALPPSQRLLMTLILRKLLSSSSFAIAGTLRSLVNKLKDMLEKAERGAFSEEVFQDFEGYDELADELEDDESQNEQVLTEEDIIAIRAEMEELTGYAELAESIGQNAKGEVLLTALKNGFEEMKRLGAPEKALIFTESKRTQDYLLSILSQTEFKDKVVLFNGSNNDDLSKKIYTQWLERHKGSDKITGSQTADKRAALVDYFKEKASIMIATEAAAEGINLQFCSMVVNYDLPWNPQRIEQRIGRCHRYGQKFDVVVINFLNKRNAADERVYELLKEKFKLFDGVFGVSDEVLGAIESGVDFEKRINEIYQYCRRTEEIKQAFDELQKELESQIDEKMQATRQKLLENFDEEVHEKLKINLFESREYLSRYEQWLMEITKYRLQNEADFLNENNSFMLLSNPYSDVNIPLGLYKMKTDDESIHNYRIGHLLAQRIIEEYKSKRLPCREVVFHYSSYSGRISLLEELAGKSGELSAWNVTVNSFEEENHIIFAGVLENGVLLHHEQCQRLFSLSAEVRGLVYSTKDKELKTILDSRISYITDEISKKNSSFFDEEMEKLDKWAEDVKSSIEMELKELDIQIKTMKTESKKIPKLEEKVKVQRQIKEYEKRRNLLRQNLFAEQDKVDEQKEKLISEIEARLSQSIHVEPLFTIAWKVV